MIAGCDQLAPLCPGSRAMTWPARGWGGLVGEGAAVLSAALPLRCPACEAPGVPAAAPALVDALDGDATEGNAVPLTPAQPASPAPASSTAPARNAVGMRAARIDPGRAQRRIIRNSR